VREFSLVGMIEHLAVMAIELKEAEHHLLEKAAKIVEAEAKNEIGHYQSGWPPLAVATLARKASDTPLLETGELRDSIGHQVEGREAVVGTNDDNGLYAELGTIHEPPRSFLAHAAHQEAHKVVALIGAGVVEVLVGGKVIL
jgi:HK97 gp10 family phage protein